MAINRPAMVNPRMMAMPEARAELSVRLLRATPPNRVIMP